MFLYPEVFRRLFECFGGDLSSSFGSPFLRGARYSERELDWYVLEAAPFTLVP